MTRLFRQVRVHPSYISRGYEVTFRSLDRPTAYEAVKEFKAAYGNAQAILHGVSNTSNQLHVSFRDVGMAMLFKLQYGGKSATKNPGAGAPGF